MVIQTDEQRWLDKISKSEPKEVGRASVPTESGPLLVQRMEREGNPEFVLTFVDSVGTTHEIKLLPGQVYRLVQLVIALADINPGQR